MIIAEAVPAPRFLPLQLALVLLLISAGCFRSVRTAELPIEVSAPAGPEVSARLAVPSDWRPLQGSSARAEFVGPDNHSTAYLRAMPGPEDAKRCPALVRKYSTEVIDSWGGPPRTRVAHRKFEGGLAEFELRRMDPKPAGEVIWSRVVCQTGALAIASCTTPAPRASEMEPLCRKVLDSLDIRPSEAVRSP